MTATYYSDESVTLYHGDCREVAEWLSADVLVTDPPYGMGYVSNHRIGTSSKPIAGDADITVRDATLEAWGDRPALVFGRWDSPRPAATRARLVWDKNLLGTGDLRFPWGRSDEEIYVLGQWPPVQPGGRRREGGTPNRHPSVIRWQGLAPGAAFRPDHPTPKPVGLMADLIGKCPPGVIADPFAGSGSTLIAARAQGRQSIGVEVEERYCELIASRLAQGDLFGGAA